MPTWCKFPKCTRQSYYNYEEETTALFCSNHKKDDMINVKAYRCIVCNKTASYSLTGHRATHCSTHKLDNMKCVRYQPICEYDGCKKWASYNFEGETKRQFCTKHKLPNMINLCNKNICLYENCTTYASFNYPNEKKKIYCATHKKDDMIDVSSKKCIFDDCMKQAIYNYEGMYARYCGIHKKDDMIDVKVKRCKIPECDVTISDKRNEGYCTSCYVKLFPDREHHRNYKTKERAIYDYLSEHFGNRYNIVWDTRIANGYSMRRPDFVIDLGYQVLIIEVDENQHKKYDCTCSNKRLMELSQDVNHRPLVFIRFNPDGYKNMNGRSIASCWGRNGTGLCVLKRNKKKEWNERCKTLGDHISYWLDENNKTDKTLEVIELYYDMNL